MTSGKARRLLVVVTVASFLALGVAACDGGGDEAAHETPVQTAPVAARLIVYEARGEANALNIYTIDPRTGETRQLTTDGQSKHPSWSPDRREIVFASDAGNADKQEDLYIMRADGGDVRRLTSTPGVSEWHPRISPDGSRIAYVSLEGDVAFIKVMNVDGSQDRRISEAFKLLRSGVWHPGGGEFFFSGLPVDARQFDIFSIDVTTGELRVRIGTPYSEACPHITSDGRTLTYGSVFEEADGSQNIDLFAHDMGSDVTSGAGDLRMTDDPTVDDYGDPDADGAAYVFIARRDGNPELYLVDRDGTNERRLTNTPDLHEDNPDW